MAVGSICPFATLPAGPRPMGRAGISLIRSRAPISAPRTVGWSSISTSRTTRRASTIRAGSFRWFSGALTNLSHNCLDHHVGRGWGGHAALVTENERGEQRVFTYAQMLGAVEAVAVGLRRIGVRRGDRVAIYMPTCAEAIMAMLATCRIGAIHLVVFAGFGR